MHHIVYKTTNLINGKIYVGVHSTQNLNDSYLGSGNALSKAIKKYGKINFKRETLIECSTREEAFEIEVVLVDKTFINRLDVYNARFGGLGANFGVRFVYLKESGETIQIERDMFNPDIHAWVEHSDAAKLKISRGNKGKIRSNEVKERISKTLTGRTDSEETKKKKKKTTEQRKLLSELNKGKVVSDEIREKISTSHKGKPKSPEHRQKLAEANRKRAAAEMLQKQLNTEGK